MTRDAENTPLEKTRLEDFPSRTFDKLRYVDTDRQGHINNGVFASMLETGRAEILYNPGAPLAAPGCSFVIAQLTLDFRSQLTWPGRVDIGTRVVSVGRSSITLEQGLFQEGVCAATATTVIVHVSGATRRSEPLHEPATSALELLRR